MADIKLIAEDRKLTGRKVKALRREGVLPANVYGKNVKSKTIKVDLLEFEKIFEKVGETSIIDLVIGKKKLPVLISNTQVDPVTDNPIHVDFYQINLKEKVTAQIPVELVGESPAEKQGLGTVVQHVNEIEIEALPTNLPEKFEIDLTKLKKVDDQVQVKNIKIDKKKIEIKDEEKEKIIVKVESLRKEEEVVVKAEEVVEGEEEKVEGEEAVKGTGEKAPEGEEGKPQEKKEEGKEKK